MLWEVMGLASKRERGAVAALEQRSNWAIENAREDIEELVHEVDQLRLLVKTIATICMQHKVFTEAEFKDLQDFIDVQDGELDGKHKVENQPKACKKCKRQNNHMAKVCMWCEADLK